ncbi:MAG: DNA mismatch endonuclease Vsr [Methylococcaceae bacterium]|nr:DNA mismatch endonuclease Vsr [Methylococcaceae bacterium]
MTDRIDQPTRSRIMAAIRSVDTRPEKCVRSALHEQGFRFRLHPKQLPGTPDLVLRKYKTVIFINGCFWHQHQNCKAAHLPKTRCEFWQKKFARNVARDQNVLYQLKIMGWRTAILWECGLHKKPQENTLRRLALWLKGGDEYLEIPVYDEFNEQ